jgi:hypothetical protein
MTQTVTVNEKGQKNINGVTLKQVTGIMKTYERIINWYNKKYNFEVPANEKQYHSALQIWDTLKAKRDLLTA